MSVIKIASPPWDAKEVAFPADMVRSFRDARRLGHLLDARLRSTDAVLFPIHKFVLDMYSTYLRQNIEDNQTNDIFDLPLPSDTLRQTLNFVYDENLEITDSNVEQLIHASHVLGIRGLFEKCCEIVDSELDNTNAVRYLQMAKRFEGCISLRKKINSFILANFTQVMRQSEGFRNLELDDVQQFLKSDDLNARQEKDVFEAANVWIGNDPDTRAALFPILFKAVRLALCSSEFLAETVALDPKVRTNADCSRLVNEAISYRNDKESRDGEIFHVNIPFARPRVPHDIIFAIGGWSGGSASSVVECYDSHTDRWFLISNGDQIPRAYHGMVTCGKLIYVIGGFDGTECLNSVRTLDPVTQEWKERGCMHDQRCYVSAVEMNGTIYAMGGLDGYDRLNSCESYEPKNNQWSWIANMNSVRSDACAAVLQNKVYIVGGFTGRYVLRSAEVYDPETNQWSYIRDMNSRRSGLSLVTYRDRLYALGGFDGDSRLRTGEVYDAERNTWTDIQNMSFSRSNFAAAVLDDKIFAIGGFQGNTTVSLVETYSSESNHWEPVASMAINRSALNCCVVKGLMPTTKQYSFLGNAQ